MVSCSLIPPSCTHFPLPYASVQGTTVFNVSSYTEANVTFYLYTGWGLNASSFRVLPDDP